MKGGLTALPPAARVRLTERLRSRPRLSADDFGHKRTMVLPQHIRASRLNALKGLAVELEDSIAPHRFAAGTWPELKAAADRVADARHNILAMVVALYPFDLRLAATSAQSAEDKTLLGHDWGEALLSACDGLVVMPSQVVQPGDGCGLLDC